jgi:tetratricopeptide (TPR) repeat protein
MWYSITACLAATLATFSVEAESPVAAPSPAMGEMVDADLPATYRLPPVQLRSQTAANPASIFSAPLGPSAAAGPVAESQITPALTPAGSPPDDGLGAAEHAGACHDVVDSGDAAVPAEITPVEIAQREVLAPERGQEHFAPKTPHDHRRDGARPVPGGFETTSSPYTPTTAELTSQMLPAVQRGFGLARRGALYAARTEFVQVLRRVAQAQDAAADTGKHSRALAAGLRALDEAEDFVPAGVQMEAELDVRTAASSHRTSVLPEEPEEVSPFEAVALYHSFAQEQLKEAVAGEQAGSMALYGLGTIYAQLAQRNDDDVQLTRGAMTMYSAALSACPNNHLAANELGVLVCRAGRADEAAALFEQTINFAPSAIAYHNLAMAQQRIGLVGPAAANELESQRLAALERSRGEVSRRAGVQWVTPDEMARASQPINRTATGGEPVAQPPAKSTWKRVVESTKSLPLPGSGRAKENLGPVQSERVAQPMGAPGQGMWR